MIAVRWEHFDEMQKLAQRSHHLLYLQYFDRGGDSIRGLVATQDLDPGTSLGQS